MTETYAITLPREKAATYRAVTFIIACINGLSFAYALFSSRGQQGAGLFYIGFGLGIAAILSLTFQHRVHLIKSFQIEIAFIICSILWLISGNYLPGILLFIFALLGFAANKKPVILFSREHILYPSLPVKKISWQEVDFVLLKDDILTIEMANNRLMQFTLDAETASVIDDDRFNSFCESCKSSRTPSLPNN
jgi:hypothetical protein